VVSSVGAWVVGFAYPLHREDLVYLPRTHLRHIAELGLMEMGV